MSRIAISVGETVGVDDHGDIIVTDSKLLGGAVSLALSGSSSREDKTTPTAIAMEIAMSTSPNTIFLKLLVDPRFT
jgi:hypothetical protein